MSSRRWSQGAGEAEEGGFPKIGVWALCFSPPQPHTSDSGKVEESG